MKQLRIPLIIALSIILGIIIGNFFALNATRGVIQHKNNSKNDKLSYMLNTINAMYVDSVNIDSIVELIIPDILANLDPHSSYIPAKDLQAVNEELEGSFSGIGVQFNIQSDTIYIVDVISGGPAERAGLLAGDRIVTVDDSLFVGKTINNEKVMRTLRGEKNSTVKLGISRRTAPEILNFEIIRGDIPINSIDIAYMIDPETGFIAINKFASNTYRDFLNSLASLQRQGAKKYIIDLRGNSGGYMDAALNMLNEFLAMDDMLVYVEGKAFPRTESRANGTGSFQQAEVVVLIDEFSGSASEIFAGAIQDNDRGTLIGRRSFGKGLVQQQRDFPDHSAMRLTVARYYTPSGRSIQKPYTPGDNKDYEEDIYNRFLHGEFYTADSIHNNDSLIYTTKQGRTVYGGGGIMPDIFVPRDTARTSPYFYALVNYGCIYQFALKYTDANRETLNQFKKDNDWQGLNNYLNKQNLFSQLETFASEKKITGTAAQKARSKSLILEQLNAYIVRNILGDNGFYPLLNLHDKTVQTAIKKIHETANN